METRRKETKKVNCSRSGKGSGMRVRHRSMCRCSIGDAFITLVFMGSSVTDTNRRVRFKFGNRLNRFSDGNSGAVFTSSDSSSCKDEPAQSLVRLGVPGVFSCAAVRPEPGRLKRAVR
ncbi:hypothetical protein INR49_006619 [Caranx melampygus]|nr:hypothetical protein INR49_006619 [Caranx melampygus]